MRPPWWVRILNHKGHGGIHEGFVVDLSIDKNKVVVIIIWCLGVLFAFAGCKPSQTGSVPQAESAIPGESRTYEVTQRLVISNQGPGSPQKQNLWVALIQDFPPYQSAELVEITPEDYQPVVDEDGNRYAEFNLSEHPAGTEIQVRIEYQVTVYGQTFDLGDCQGELPQDFIQAELHVESNNPQIQALAETLSRGSKNPCEQVRAFYDYAGDTLVYTPNRNNWGAQAALGEMGADCSEYSSLVIALSRAAGIPARYYEGLLYQADPQSGLAQTEHAWLDVTLPGSGWVPLDPTLGRLPLTREGYFGTYTPDHIIITTGRNPSTLRGASYWSHLYWPGDSASIRITEAGWEIRLVDEDP